MVEIRITEMPCRKVPFKGLCVGDKFYFGDSLYVKTSYNFGLKNAVDLGDGCLYTFRDTALVDPEECIKEREGVKICELNEGNVYELDGRFYIHMVVKRTDYVIASMKMSLLVILL